MKVNVMSRRLIKPSTPTPQNLKKYKLSLPDELSASMNVSVIFFYPPNPKPKPTTHDLEQSLAKTLPKFYIISGRYIRKDQSIDCNDEGIEFVEAEAVDVELMDFIVKTKNDQLNGLISRQTQDVDKATDPLLSIQITEFKCGGLAFTVTLSHRIADASSIRTFIASWFEAINHPDGRNISTINPTFDSPSLFPGTNLQPDLVPRPNTVFKRLLFNRDAISSLRSKISRPHVNGEGIYYSRVCVVSALIAKARIGMDRAKHGKPRATFIAHALNLRGRTNPPLPSYTFGNLAITSLAQCMASTETEENVGFQDLVYLIGDAIRKTIGNCASILSLDEDGRNNVLIEPSLSLWHHRENDYNVVLFSDWSKFGFYEADFGWGQPVWVGAGSQHGAKITILMDNKEGDGIEAWVFMNPSDVPYFEQDEDMKLFGVA